MKKLIAILTTLIFAVSIIVCCKKENEPPVIKTITASPQAIKTGEITQLTCAATDPDGDQLTYSWSSTDGTFPNGKSENAIIWEAPEQQGEYPLNVIVDDGQNIVDGSVTVSVEANPEITVNCSNLDFLVGYGTEGSNISIQNTGTGTLTWTISVDASWLNVSPTSGETTTETDQIEIIAIRDDLEPGKYLTNITINSNAGDKQINISMEVASLQGTYTDSRDNHQYRWVKIGEQIWMVENLAYDAGDGCWAYNNEESNVYRYGRLYIWEVAQQACPTGWHLPSDAEWEQLAQYVSDSKGPFLKNYYNWLEVGNYLKATFGWNNNGNGTDDFGFFAFPSGSRSYNGEFYYGTINCSWFSSTETEYKNYVYGRALLYYTSEFQGSILPKSFGFSVRCIMD